MKFGRNLPRNQVPEWAASYINYKGLKRLIKREAEKQKCGQELDITPFFFSLDRNVEMVDAFFNKRLAECTRRLHLLKSRYAIDSSTTPQVPDGLDRGELEDLVAALLELRSGLRKITWYGEVNRRGFIKILKKVDKKTNICVQKRYLETKVFPKAFAVSTEAEAAKAFVNAWLSKVVEADGHPAKDDDDARSDTSSNTTRHLLMRTASPGVVNGVSGLTIEAVEQSIRDDDAIRLEKILLETSSCTKFSPSTNDSNLVTQKLFLNLLQRAINNKAVSCIDMLLGRTDSLHEEDDIHERNAIHRVVIAIGRSNLLCGVVSMNTPTLSLPVSSKADFLQGNAGTGNPAYLTTSHEQTFYITPAESPMTTPPTTVGQFEFDGTVKPSAHDESVKLLRYLLEKLRPTQRSALVEKDAYGRMPLHYAAQYGFLVICQLVVKFMKEWEQFDVGDGIDSPQWQDTDGLAPLHLAVMNGHPKTTRYLLQAESWDGTVGALPTSEKILTARKSVLQSSAVLIMATKSNAITIVKLLVDAGVNLNYQDEHGETALHTSSRLGYIEAMRILISGGADVEITENSYGWTPVFIAAVEGQLAALEILVEEGGAEVARLDSSGWSAIEHAALRGHIEVARKLKEISRTILASPQSGITIGSAPIQIGNTLGTISERNSPIGSSAGSSIANGNSSLPGSPQTIPKIVAPNTDTVKSFGHRYLKQGTTMILVTLGSVDTRKTSPAVKLDKIPLSHAHSTQLDTVLSLVVSAKNAKGDPTIIDLPVQHTLADDPIVFEAADINNVHLLFDIVPTYSGRHDHKIGRAVALLSTIKQTLGRSRVSLQGGVQVPILSANAAAEVIGTIDFEFMVITPFVHEGITVTADRTYWKSVSGPKVIGHRGLGKNMAARKSLQLGENTVQSFIAAANLGASYVEFDVQLTKDHAPVIYHDFTVGETGIDAPVHTLTLEQFLAISEQHTPHDSRAGSPDRFSNCVSGSTVINGTGFSRGSPPTVRRSRSMSLDQSSWDNDANGKMKYTRNYKLKGGFKGNSRGTSIQGPFTTLEEVFKKLPKEVGFNIELKYPMLQESEQEEMDTFGIEMNSWVDTVLKVVYDRGQGRDIIFSSFHPDICLMLSLKQPSIPVLFLTEGGTAKMADIRASSLQEAIRFASRWNLLGIVSAAEPLVLCPRLIRIIKESGLVCVTYGTLNNTPENVKVQVEQGVDAVIVDSVLAIRKGLTAAAAEAHGADSNKKHDRPLATEVASQVDFAMKGVATAVAN